MSVKEIMSIVVSLADEAVPRLDDRCVAVALLTGL